MRITEGHVGYETQDVASRCALDVFELLAESDHVLDLETTAPRLTSQQLRTVSRNGLGGLSDTNPCYRSGIPCIVSDRNPGYGP